MSKLTDSPCALKPFEKDVVIENLYRHIRHLSVDIGDRHLWKAHSLERSAEYIESCFEAAGYAVKRQTYTCYGKQVSNLMVEKPGIIKDVIVTGAHYDTMPGTPGADDNASAVAGLLELARMLRESPTQKTIIFAAFVNEESPCFGSSNMGSMVYAGYLRERNIPVEVMISLEMIGFFSKECVQTYPFPFMDFFYPKTADFIGVAGNFHSSKYVRWLKRGMRKSADLTVRSLTGPSYAGGIHLSDNSSFWRHGYKAVMVTDTSFFRNRHYHQETDTIETLHFESMAEVVKGLYGTLKSA